MTRAVFALVFFLAAHVGADPRPHRPIPDAPPPQLMVNIKALLDAARLYGLDARLVFSVAWAESELKEWAKARRWREVDGQMVRVTTARGLMQINPRYQDELVALYLGWHPSNFNWANPVHSAKLGCAYLAALIRRFGTWGGIAAYNCGPGRYQELQHGRALPRETVDYVRKVLG